MSRTDQRVTVAVIGAGPLGIVAIKNLVEEGFDVTGFDRNDYIGGLWKYRDDDQTSVLKTTLANISKKRGCFTDFPWLEGEGTHPTADEVHTYLVEYAKNFGLLPRIKLGTLIRHVTFSDEHGQWVIDIEGSAPQYFDKVVMAVGVNTTPSIPKIENLESFRGQYIHSRAFKRPSDFKGQRVVVVGFGNTAADTATQLVGHASSIHLSHRHGCIVLPRWVDGKPVDHTLTYRIQSIQDRLWHYVPWLAEKIFQAFVTKLQNKSFTLRPEWNFSPAPSLKQSVPTVSDTLVPYLEKGEIKSVAGLKRVTGLNSVELLDGTKLDVDSIVFATGYKPNFDLLDPKYDPTADPPAGWADIPGSNGKPLVSLYQNIFSLKKPDSLAFMGTSVFPASAFQIFDMASMALAQIWKGNSSLPPQDKMEEWVRDHQEWVRNLAKDGSVYSGIVRGGQWMWWANEVAGTGINEKLGFGLQGWLFWLKEKRLCNLFMSGIYSPHLYRVFDVGKRKPWVGAVEAIERANYLDEAGQEVKKDK